MHLDTLASVPGVKPVVISDVVEPVLKMVTEKYGVPKYTMDVSACVAFARLVVVVVVMSCWVCCYVIVVVVVVVVMSCNCALFLEMVMAWKADL